MSTPAPASPFPRRLILLLASALCFGVALLLALGAFDGGDESAWVDGGLLALALSFV